MLELAYIEESVGAFHARDVATIDRPTMWVPLLSPTPTLVLGSRQHLDTVDQEQCRRRGVEVVSRRSGGAAVLVGSEQLMWFDVLLTRDHPGWHDDVHKSFRWLSERLVSALTALGLNATAHYGPMVNTTWSDLVCFAGLGPGEITIEGKKLVGISQRRTRNVARYQVAILRRWQPEDIVSLFALDPAQRDQALHELPQAATNTSLAPETVLTAIATTLEATEAAAPQHHR